MSKGDFVGIASQFKLDRSTIASLLAAGSRPPKKPDSEKSLSRKTNYFLKGPIPLPWVINASALPGKALHVGVALWFYSGLTRSKEVALNLTALGEWGVQRDAARRGLEALEKARLVQVNRHPGRKPVVKILV